MMQKRNIGILHPGKMGISVAASLQKGGHTVYWLSDGRSPATQQRADEFGLLDAKTLAAFCETCEIIVSVCPPHAAEAVAKQVLAHAFQGLYVDANAISPQRSVHIGELMENGGIAYVDGGIVGGPAWEPGKTWLHLSGERAEEVAELFQSGPMETNIVGEEIGKASALKICFAAYTKGTTALLSAILATAEALDVRQELMQQWSKYWPDFADETEQRVRRVTAKAWRFAGEMEEIAATFQNSGLPGEFHEGAGEVYRRIAKYKDSPAVPPIDTVLKSLMQAEGKEKVSNFVKVARVEDIPAGEKIWHEFEYETVIILNVDGEFYCIADLCSHDDGPLEDGKVDGYSIECPRHGACFDVRTGNVLALPATAPIPTYQVKVENGDIYIENLDE